MNYHMIQPGDYVTWVWNGQVTSGVIILIYKGIASVETGDPEVYKCVAVKNLRRANHWVSAQPSDPWW